MARVLFVPASGKGEGSGHLVRCARLARALDASVYIESADRGASRSRRELEIAFREELEGVSIVDEASVRDGYDLVVLDRKRVSKGELDRWERLGCVVAIDEGGPCRASMPYLVDMLPGRSRVKPNLLAPGLSGMPRSEGRTRSPVRKVLVSFGAEDAALLGPRCALALSDPESGLPPDAEISLVAGPLSRYDGLDAGRALRLPYEAGLRDRLGDFDLVVTHFGLTAFESAAARTPVVLASPGREHDRLAREAGFPAIALKSSRSMRGLTRAFAKLLASGRSLEESLPRVDPDERPGGAISALAPASGARCPSCRSSERISRARFPARTHFRCLECGLAYQARFGAIPEYGEGYFFEDYRVHYGRSYLEDADAIKAACAPRIDILSRMLAGNGRPAVLDVGCAYGFFLDLVAEKGWKARGVDVSLDAVSGCGKRGHVVARADFGEPGFDPESLGLDGRFDALSMWYVIEHFERLDTALENARRVLAKGGVFAFSTPSGEGVSARRSIAGFLGSSPEDHYSILEPSRVATLLSRHGFKLERLRVTGHHPERFSFGTKDGPGAALAMAISRLFGLGDTFEAYARKI